MRPRREGGLRGPPIGDFTLERRIIGQLQRGHTIAAKHFWVNYAIIKILTQHRHAFAMAGLHGTVDFFHPDPRCRNQRT